jgi:hypothetical protein
MYSGSKIELPTGALYRCAYVTLSNSVALLPCHRSCCTIDHLIASHSRSDCFFQIPRCRIRDSSTMSTATSAKCPVSGAMWYCMSTGVQHLVETRIRGSSGCTSPQAFSMRACTSFAYRLRNSFKNAMEASTHGEFWPKHMTETSSSLTA